MKNSSKSLRVIVSAIFVVALGIGAHAVLAGQNNLVPPPSPEAGTCINVHGPHPCVEGVTVKNDLDVETPDVTPGVDIGNKAPNGAPGAGSQPFATFSGVNTPIILNSAGGGVQISDDAQLWGSLDIRGQIFNGSNTSGMEPGAPLDINDSVKIHGTEGGAGNLDVSGDIKSMSLSTGGGIDIKGNAFFEGPISSPLNNITGQQIGSFVNGWSDPVEGGISYKTVPTDGSWVTDVGYCPAGTYLVSCRPQFWWAPPSSKTNNVSWYQGDDAQPESCSIVMKQSGNELLRYIALGTCFDPQNNK